MRVDHFYSYLTLRLVMKLSDVYKLVSKDLNLPEPLVKATYISYWKYIRDTIESLPLKELSQEEEFNKLKVNFNIPSLGKLGTSWDRLLGVKARLMYLKK